MVREIGKDLLLEGNGQLFLEILQVQHQDSSRSHGRYENREEEWGVFLRICLEVV